MNLQTLISMIPEDSQDEALRSIEAIVTYPMAGKALVRCNLSREFRLTIGILGSVIDISAEGRKPVVCSTSEFVSVLRRTIFAIDEAIAEGSYKQGTQKLVEIFDRPASPMNMDIPVWDENAGKWHDAEY